MRPKEFKDTPVYKSGDKSVLINYRSITVMTGFFKIFKKLLKNGITRFIGEHSIISSKQFDFIEGLSI